MNVDLNQIRAVSAEEAAIIAGLNSEEFSEPGVYYIRAISHDKFDAEVTELDCLGDITEIQLPSEEEEFAAAGSARYWFAIEDDMVCCGWSMYPSPRSEINNIWVKVV